MILAFFSSARMHDFTWVPRILGPIIQNNTRATTLYTILTYWQSLGNGKRWNWKRYRFIGRTWKDRQLLQKLLDRQQRCVLGMVMIHWQEKEIVHRIKKIVNCKDGLNLHVVLNFYFYFHYKWNPFTNARIHLVSMDPHVFSNQCETETSIDTMALAHMKTKGIERFKNPWHQRFKNGDH